MSKKTKKQIEDLSRRVRSLEKDNHTLFSLLHCHDCQRYPTKEVTADFCKICEDSCFRLKLKVESDVPKKTCIDDMDLFKK